MERDISTYAVVGRELLAGRPLYSDLWDHKPPGVHLIFAGATAVVGPGVPAVLLVNVALSIAVIGTMMGGAYRVGGARCAVVCGGMWAAVGIDLGLQANQPNVELAMNLCISLALAASLAATPQDKGRGAGPIGVLTAFAVLLKPVAAAQFGLLAAVEIGERWRNRQKGESARYFGRWVGAAVAILVIVMSWCVFRAGFDPVWDAVIRYNLSYAKGSLLDNLVEVPRFWLYLPLTSVAVIVLLSMATIRGLVVVGAPVRHRILAVLTGAVIAIAAPGRFYPHYYQLLLVPLVLAAAAGLSEGLGGGGIKKAWAIAVVAILAVVEVQSLRLSPETWSRLKYGEVFLDEVRLAADLEDRVSPGEFFWQLGPQPGLYLLTETVPASGVVYDYPLLKTSPLRDLLAERVIADLARNRPVTLVVRERGEDRGVLSWVQQHYRERAGSCPVDGYSVWVLDEWGSSDPRGLAVPAEPPIFGDGFENGNTSGWSR